MVGIATAEGRIGALDPDSRILATADGGADGKTPDFALNTQQIGVDGFMYRYVQASGAIAASQTDIAVDAAGQASDGAGVYVGTLAFADNEYGWVRSPVIASAAT
jgi:hypothetical protein